MAGATGRITGTNLHPGRTSTSHFNASPTTYPGTVRDQFSKHLPKDPAKRLKDWVDFVDETLEELPGLLPEGKAYDDIVKMLKAIRDKGEAAVFEETKRNRTARVRLNNLVGSCDVEVSLHVDASGTPYLEFSELALNSGQIEVLGGEDGGIADFGRSHLVKSRLA